MASSPEQQQRPALRCPRCDSSNTKFCYYNNYSLSQPRHFCKSCRRYWTQGGALRNVPVGGASRKSKKPRRSSISSPTPSIIPPPPPSNFLNYPLINTTTTANDSAAFFASSIESLSSFNQELHWKLQQDRMSLLLDNKPQPIFFHNLEPANSYAPPNHSITTAGGDNVSPNTNQWFFNTTSSYAGGDGSGSGNRNNNIENEGDENNVATKLNSAAGGYVLDRDGVIKFQQYAQWLDMKKI